jgi:hypothetical protein
MSSKRHTCRSCGAVQPFDRDAEVFTCSFCGEQERMRDAIPEAIPLAQPASPPRLPVAQPIRKKPQTSPVVGCVTGMFGGCLIVATMIGLLVFAIVFMLYRSLDSLDEIIKENERRKASTQRVLFQSVNQIVVRIEQLQRWPTDGEMRQLLANHQDAWGRPLAAKIEESGRLVVSSRGIDGRAGTTDDLTADAQLGLNAEVFWDESDSVHQSSTKPSDL